MPTLAELQAHVADDIADTTGEYAVQIARAVMRAIAKYQRQRFYFNERRDVDIGLEAGQQFYDATNNEQIPKLLKIDAAFLLDGEIGQVTVDTTETTVDDDDTFIDGASGLGGSPVEIHTMRATTPEHLELIGDSSASRSRPYLYSYFNQQLRIYPIPDSANYTMRLQAWVRVDAPTVGTESNAWTTEAYDLIHAAAKRYLAQHTLRDADLAVAAGLAEQDALMDLQAETSSKNGTGIITPTCW